MSRRSDDQRFPVLRSRPADFVDRAGMTEINRDVAIFDGWIDCIAEIALRDNVDLWIVLGQIDNRLAHSTASPDQRHAHRRSHFVFSNALTVFRRRAWFASVISQSGRRTSADIAPRQPSAVFTGTGFGSMNKSLNNGDRLRCKTSAHLSSA